jgi:hypothetical protein
MLHAEKENHAEKIGRVSPKSARHPVPPPRKPIFRADAAASILSNDPQAAGYNRTPT